MSCQIVIVLGMHRSGTSAVAGYLHSLGLELPSETLSAHPQDNPEGYFEPQRMVQLNNRLLAALGLNWQSTRPISPDELAAPELGPIKEEVKQYLAETCRPGRKLVFKDPRLCRLLPLWLPLIQQYCNTPLIIHTVRSARAVADSLARRAEQQELAGAAITNRQKATLLWLRYNLDAWHHARTAGLPLHTLSYETFSTDNVARKALQQWLQSELALPASKPAIPRPARPLQTPREWPADQDWQLMLSHAERCLATSDTQEAREWLSNLHTLAEIRIPARHQNDAVEPPPEDLIIEATIKHISGQQPKPLPEPLTAAHTKGRLHRVLSSLKRAVTKTKQNNENQNTKEIQPEYLFISAHPTSRSHIYRVKNPVDALNRAGHSAAWLTPEQALQNPDAWRHCKKLIIHRCEWSDTLSNLYQKADAFGITKIYDIDDYIFEPALIDQGCIDFIKRLPEHQKQEWKLKIGRFRTALLNADKAMVPTQPLLNAINGLGKPCSLKSNGLSPENIALATHWRKAFALQPNTSKIRFGYASGTPTHDRDFSLIKGAIAEALTEHPNLSLIIIGPLNLDQLLKILPEKAKSQIERRDLVEHINLPYELARFSLNLAPLELDNPFCDAKSPLKWFEAAACGVPTVASSTHPYKNYIHSGIDGYLCASSEDWNQCLQRLARLSEMQINVGSRNIEHLLEDRIVTGYVRDI